MTDWHNVVDDTTRSYIRAAWSTKGGPVRPSKKRGGNTERKHVRLCVVFRDGGEVGDESGGC
jgi:hypothetical protein